MGSFLSASASRRLAFLLAVGCTPLVSACVSKPTMHLNHAEISGVSGVPFPMVPFQPQGVGLVLTVVLDVYNPNGYDVAVRAMRGQTVLADKYPLPIDFHPPGDGLWLPAGQTTSVRVPVTLPLPIAMALVQEAIASPTIPYHVTGTADVTGTRSLKIERDNYAVDETGSITREQMAAVIPASIMGPH